MSGDPRNTLFGKRPWQPSDGSANLVWPSIAWRATFGIIGVLALVTVGGLAWTFLVPKLERATPQVAYRPDLDQPPLGVVPLLPADGSTSQTHSLGDTAISPPARPGEYEQRVLDIAKSRQQTIVHRAERLRAQIASIQADVKHWNRQVETLWDEDLGRQLAVHADLVQQFRALTEQELPETTQVADLSVTLESLVRPYEEALRLEDDGTPPPPQLAENLDSMEIKLSVIGKAWKAAVKQLDTLVERVQLRGSETNSETLREIVGKLETEDTESLNQELAEMKRKADEDRRQKLLAAEAERQQSETQRELDQLQQAEEELQKKHEEAAQARRDDEQRARLRRKAQTPDVQRYLANLMAPGFMQPVRGQEPLGGIEFQRTAEKGPISFTALKSLGALEPTVTGLMKLNICCGSAGNFVTPTDRPRWQFPFHYREWSDDDQAFIRRAQDLLNELGPILVELEMLSP